MAETETTETEPSPLDHARNAMLGLEAQLNAKYLERKEEIRGLILAAIAGEHVLLLGPPGTAKSALTVDFSRALGMRSFITLMGKTSTVDQVFGPLDLGALKNNRYERAVDGYMPTAEVAFIDEIFKANSTILNSLLTMLNERQYDQGAERLDCPLRTTVGASNEMPQDDGLDALFDRFLIRREVAYLRDHRNFEAMLSAASQEIDVVEPTIINVLAEAMDAVSLEKVIPAMGELRNTLNREHSIVASDRRWRSALKVIRASAVLNGRAVASLSDMRILADVLWSRLDDVHMIRDVVVKLRSPEMTAVVNLCEALQEERALLGDMTTLDPRKVAGAAQTHLKVQNILVELAAKVEAVQDADDRTEAEEMQRRAKTTAQEIREGLGKLTGLTDQI